MSVVRVPSARPAAEEELEFVVQLAVRLSARLTECRGEALGSVIAQGLDQLAVGLGADVCRLVEFSEAGTATHSSRSALGVEDAPVLDTWLIERLARGVLVAIPAPGELPPEAFAARQRGTTALLGVPAAIGQQIVCALVVETVGTRRPWPEALIAHVTLLASILAGALLRVRQETAVRANVAVIEQLNTRLKADNTYLTEEIKTFHDFDEIVGESAPLRLALTRVSQVAPTNCSVLIQGQTGTGKELFARAVHARSRRQARPLVRVNCAALPPTLIESELFGHERGAFTGAVGMRQGRFELADGGTIFLDEIGTLPLDLQVKFLRVLQEGEFERVGSSHTRRVDVRVIAATNRDLEAAVKDGTFREDLYYRLSVYPIRVPALAERRDDIPRLVWFFIHRRQRDLGRRITKVPQGVMDALQRQAWPGNVRQLENVVERAMIGSTGEVLQLDEGLGGERGPTVAGASDTLDSVQRAHIEAVLARCGWRINGTGNAAERLGVHPNTLRFRMKKLGVASPSTRVRQDREALVPASV